MSAEATAMPPDQSRDDARACATAHGTTRFAERFDSRFVSDFFRPTSFGVGVSSIGLGTYLGDSTGADDAAYEETAAHAIRSGINLLDTAINYRGQRSERAIGSALKGLFLSGDARRDEVVVCTKGGYLPLGETPPSSREEYQAYVQREFIDQEILLRDEIVAGGHSFAPRFLRYCIAKSRQNLGLRTIDLYYLHNPEQQLGSVTAEALRARLRTAFTVLEESVARGEIGAYGCATWDGLRAPPGARGHIALEELVSLARETGGDAHHFRAVQLPINLAMPEAARALSQPLNGTLVPLLQAADALGVSVFASATLMQGQLSRGLPDVVRESFSHCTTDAQRAVSFTRGLAIAGALVGMKRVAHVDENLDSARP
jgi:aryl-alcohol dehydrogenase-like predicted oxidoreductase